MGWWWRWGVEGGGDVVKNPGVTDGTCVEYDSVKSKAGAAAAAALAVLARHTCYVGFDTHAY